jgi:hypothetical protein
VLELHYLDYSHVLPSFLSLLMLATSCDDPTYDYLWSLCGSSQAVLGSNGHEHPPLSYFCLVSTESREVLGVYGLSVPHTAVIRKPPSQYPLNRSLLVSATIVARLEKIVPQCRCLSTNNPLKPCKSTYFVFCDTVLRTTTGFLFFITVLNNVLP